MPVVDSASLAQAVTGVTAHLDGDFLGRQRWFGAKSRPVAGVTAEDWAWLVAPGSARVGEPMALVIARVAFTDGGSDLYLLPLALLPGEG
ncbi:MAG TPA: hypothetical protein VHN99_06715, partial [Deinococcales bacterium]|nr:hypothetical protein [Deinococcales bacterium]